MQIESRKKNQGKVGQPEQNGRHAVEMPRVQWQPIPGGYCSVVREGDAQDLFLTVSPLSGRTIQQQFGGVLKALSAECQRRSALAQLVQMTVFLADERFAQACREIVEGHFGQDRPATCFVPQKPADGGTVAIEAWARGVGSDTARIERLSEQAVLYQKDRMSWLHCMDILPETQSPAVYDRSLSGFAAMRSVLDSAGVAFQRVVRTWLYLGDIVGPEGETQRYKELNRARTDFYADIPFASGWMRTCQCQGAYPASTGIGADGREIAMGCLALATNRRDVRATPLENPRQIAACAYDSKYSPKSPKFSRAMAITQGNTATLFISGTASITQSETQHIDDVAGQTEETLTNIEALISEENMAGHGLPGRGSSLSKLACLRAYIKRPEDYETVRAVCSDRVGELPIIYTVADVCRPDLLVEIEGIAYS